MQLTRPSIAQALAAATTLLLGPAAQGAGWQADSALMVYEEEDGVRSVSPSVSLVRELGDQRRLALTFQYDSLSGASPSGASGAAQTVTSPSGKPVQITQGNGLVNAPFEDERKALSLAWESRLGGQTRYTVSSSWSEEVDFRAAAVAGRLTQGFLKNNLTLGLGLAWEEDRIDPVGGTPVAFSLNGGSTPKGGTQQRRQGDLLLSAEVVLSPRTVVDLAFGHSQASGYLTDPYKVITVVSPMTGQPEDGQLFDDELAPNEKKANLYEKRPHERQRSTLFGEVRHALGQDALAFSWRYTQDDWEIRSHTLEGRYFHRLGQSGFYLEPSARWYTQTAAYFYRHSLIHYQDVSGSVMNIRYASADRRLAAFDAVSAGLRAGWAPDEDIDLSLRAVVYQQQGESHPDDAIGAQRSIDYFPRQTAWWVQLLLSLRW